MKETKVVGNFAEALRAHLVPVGDLATHPQNPKRGAVEEIARSLERFGQVRPVLSSGGVIIAGNHTYLAAVSLGWTHVAAIANEFESEAEARAYLLADNRLPELGTYDSAELAGMLGELAANDSWQGTGYAPADHTKLLADLGALADDAPAAPPEPRAPSGDEGLMEVVLLYDDPEFEQLSTYLKMLGVEWGSDDAPELIVRAVTEHAHDLNQGLAA